MSGGVRGVDVSSWQHPADAPIDWSAVKRAGVEFAIVKATQGTTYVNPWLAEDLDGARAAGLLVGAYHYVEAGVDGAAQGAHFVGSLVGQRLELGCWLDWELAALQDWEVTSLYNTTAGAVEEARPGVGVYCGTAWLEVFHRLGLTVRRLWLVDYGAGDAPAGVAIRQVGKDAVSGIAGEVDCDELVNARAFNRAPSPPAPPAAPETAPAAPEVAEVTSAVAEEREVATAAVEASAAE